MREPRIHGFVYRWRSRNITLGVQSGWASWICPDAIGLMATGRRFEWTSHQARGHFMLGRSAPAASRMEQQNDQTRVWPRLLVALLTAQVLILPSLPAWGAAPELAVGLVISTQGSKLLRARTETPLAARAGDLLFAGDRLETSDSSASFLFCPAKAVFTLSPVGEVQMEANHPNVKKGKTTLQPARACSLPSVLRVAVASQQHYGATMIRGAPSDFPPLPRDQLPADVAAELAPIEAALGTDPKDPAALIASATVFERHNMYANALDQYNKLLQHWPDAEWVKGKI